MLTFDEITRLGPVLSLLATLFSVFASLVAGWCLYHLSRRFVPRAAHELVKKTQIEHAERLDALERRMETVPDGKTMLKLQLSIQEIRGDLKAQDAKIDGISGMVQALKTNLDILVQSHM